MIDDAKITIQYDTEYFQQSIIIIVVGYKTIPERLALVTESCEPLEVARCTNLCIGYSQESIIVVRESIQRSVGMCKMNA